MQNRIREEPGIKSYRFLPVVSGLFTASLLISNILNSKLLRVGPLSMTGGILLWPLAYLFGDVLTEVYGYAESRKVIWAGFASLILLVSMIGICGALPAAPSWQHEAAYRVILGRVPRIAVASTLAYLAGEVGNSYVLAKSKVRTKGHFISFRFILSTVVGQLIDSALFVVVAFAGVMSVDELLSVGVSGWALKVIWELIALPLTLLLVKALKKQEHVDYFDISTDFNPFRF